MRDAFLPFCRPSITDADIAAVVRVLQSGWITTGPVAAELEAALAARTGAAGAVLVSSATGGLHCVLAALGIGPGDEVITPAMTWVSTPNVISLLGATPVFADVDRETLLMGPADVEPLITSRTRLVMPVHYAGAPVDLDPLRRLAEARGIGLVEDAAHAIGTAYRGREIGSSGTAILSFHPIKNLTTGEGGAILSDDAALLERVRRLKFHGLGVDAHDRRVQGRSPQAEVVEPGWKYNLPDMNAALGLSQLARLDAINARRAALTERYRERLAGVPGITMLADPTWEHRHARHLLVVRVNPDVHGVSREAFMERLKAANIGSGIHFRAAHRQRWYRDRGGVPSLPATEWNDARICSLPLFPEMTDRDVDDVVEAAIGAIAAPCGERRA